MVAAILSIKYLCEKVRTNKLRGPPRPDITAIDQSLMARWRSCLHPGKDTRTRFLRITIFMRAARKGSIATMQRS
jgi:hypothetical protein